MTNEPFTPHADSVQTAWVLMCQQSRISTQPPVEELEAEFGRFLARVRRDAAREALGSLQAFARDCMFNEELAAEDLSGWHHTWAAALSHRANHYPHPDDEETP